MVLALPPVGSVDPLVTSIVFNVVARLNDATLLVVLEELEATFVESET